MVEAAGPCAKEKGAIRLGVVNVVGSSIARTSHGGAYTHAGPELGVSCTNTFVLSPLNIAMANWFAIVPLGM